MKQSTDDSFKFDGNGRKFSKPVENTAGKGENTRYEQFLRFPKCFKTLVLQTRKRQSLFGKWLMISEYIRLSGDHMTSRIT